MRREEAFWNADDIRFAIMVGKRPALALCESKCGIDKFPGDLTGGETPDPIPNSEAKPVRPMIVLRGESRLSPGF